MNKNLIFALIIGLSAIFGIANQTKAASPKASAVQEVNDGGKGKESQMGEIVVFAGQDVSFHLPLASGETATINIYDFRGRLISTNQVTAKQKGLTEVNIPTNPNKKGTFIIESTMNAGISYLRVTVK